MTDKKCYPLRMNCEEYSKLKNKAQKENRSVNSFIKHKLREAEGMPNIALNNWWDDSDKLRKLIREEIKRI